MRLNYDVVLYGWGGTVVLVPYRPKYVAQYHGWMQDATLLAQTASEPLTLEEEYANCESWRDDEKKLTFIVMAGESCDGTFPVEAMAGDVNIFFHDDGAEVEVMIAESRHRRRGFGRLAAQLAMGYAWRVRRPQRFYAKIGADNAPSRALFESLGFESVGFVEAFNEFEYESKETEFPLEATWARYDAGPRLVAHEWTLGDNVAVVASYYGKKSVFVWVGSTRPPLLDSTLALAAPVLYEDRMPAATSLLGRAGQETAMRFARTTGRLVLLSWTVGEEDDVDCADPLVPRLERSIAARLLPAGFLPRPPTPCEPKKSDEFPGSS